MTSSTTTSTMSPARKRTALGILTLTVVMLSIDGTVLTLAVPALTADLDPSAAQVLWIGDIYSFALAGLLITMGNVADRIGRKRLLLLGATGFGLSSVVAAFAPTPETLIAARAVLGISGATLMPSTLSIVRNLFDSPVERTRAIAIWSAGATAGAAIGPVVGGVLLEYFWWGSVFLINVPIVLTTLLVGAVVLPESRNPRRNKIDAASSLLSLISIVPAVYAVKHAVGTGIDLSVAASSVVVLISGAWFVRRQRRSAQPMIDMSLFRLPAFSGAVLSNFIGIFAFVGLLFLFSQYLQLVRGLTPMQVGLLEVPSAAASLLVIAVAGSAARRFGLGSSLGFGLLLCAIGVGLLAFAESLPGLTLIVVAFAILGLGVGLAVTLTTDAVVSSAPKERAGAAASIAETAYELGIALGIAVLGSLHVAMYRMRVPQAADPAADSAIHESLATADSILVPSDPVDGRLLRAAHDAFTYAMQATSLVAAILLVLAAIVAWRVIPATTVRSPSRNRG